MLIMLGLISQLAYGQWTLDNDASRLSFVTIKADHVAEVHTFDLLSGSISSSGQAEITIELVSINTLIEIRDERMQNLLFETSIFPEATVTASVDANRIAALGAGQTLIEPLQFELAMHGGSNSYTTDVLITRTDTGVIVSTLSPVIVNANSFDLVQGVEALREVAGLPRISNAVPVSFTVSFNGN
ncbi:MAG: YceI family protein [Gammaproteobacteria bacterium]